MRGDVKDSRGDAPALDRFHGLRQPRTGSGSWWELRVCKLLRDRRDSTAQQDEDCKSSKNKFHPLPQNNLPGDHS